MKKILLLLLVALPLISCDIDDDGTNMITLPAKAIAIDVPDFFEQGETYELEVTYLLPDACHLPAGINAQRAAAMGNGRRDIYIWGVAATEYGKECNEVPEPATEEEANPLETKGKFPILIDEAEPFTFYLWAGIDEEGKDIFTEVVVPVGELEPEEQR